jgi:hypothetical protein
VKIDPLGNFDASGSIDIPSNDATYSIVATGDGGAESAPWLLEVHTHAPTNVSRRTPKFSPAMRHHRRRKS